MIAEKGGAMRQERIDLWQEGEYQYPHAFGFRPNLRTSFHEDDTLRPCIVIVPGGGYTHCSAAEGQIVADTFYAMGAHAAVVTYTCNLLYMEPLHLQPARDLARAVRILRKRAEEFHIDPDRIVLLGFSAGAHACGTLAELHGQLCDDLYPGIAARPDRLVLCYPVITGGEYRHRNSFDALLGKGASEKERAEWSLELHVPEDMCPVFLWQTAEDRSVPVENSYLMAQALRKKKIPFEHHVFEKGRHGLSVSTQEWEDCIYGEPYTLEQVFRILEQVRSGALSPQDEAYAGEQLEKFDHWNDPAFRDPARIRSRGAAVWPQLLNAWLEQSWDRSGK